MFGFLKSFVGYPTEMLKLIREQNNIGFDGYFKKREIMDYVRYYQRISSEKAGIQLITPIQSIFVLSSTSHEEICIPLLEFIYNRKTKKYRKEINASQDVANCVKNGNIYIKEHDYDLDLSDCESSKNTILKSIIRKIRKPERYFWIFIPNYVNSYQYDELIRTLDIRKKYQDLFGEDVIGLFHYLDYENLESRNYYDGEEALQYIAEDLKKYVKDVPMNPDERIIVDSYAKENKRENATFVPKVNTKTSATIREDNSVQENQSKTENNGYTTPAGTGTPR